MDAAILVGGQARRFGGRDKSRLRIGPATILERQVAVLSPIADRILLVASAAGHVDAPGAILVVDRMPGSGTLGAIYTALQAAASDLALVVACDMPFLRGPFLTHLMAAAGDADVAIPRTADGYQPLCAVYARRCAEPIRRRIEAGQFKVLDLLGDVRVREIGESEIAQYDPDGTLFFNVNTPEDYLRALAMADRS